MFSKFGKISGAFVLLLVFVCYPLWVAFPREKHASDIYKSTQAAEARRQVVQAKASSVETNGYLSPELHKWWGIKTEAIQDQPAERAFKAWNEKYSSPAMGHDVDHKALLASRDSDYLKARQELEKFLPQYRKAALSEVFVVPLERMDAKSPVMNFIAVRATAQAVHGYVESKAAEGEAGVALNALGPVFVLGSHIQNDGVLISHMIGLAVQAIAFDALVNELSPKDEISSKDWRRFAKMLQRSTKEPNQFIEAMESELLMMENTLEGIESGRYPLADLEEDGLGTLFRLPGFLSREHRIYRNNMGDILEDLRAERKFDKEVFNDFGFWSVFSGRFSMLSAIVIPNFHRAEAQISMNRRRLIAMTAVAGLLAFREKYGEYPKSLEQLSKVGVELPENNFLNYERQAKRATLMFSIPKDVLDKLHLVSPHSDVKSNWFQWSEQGGTFRL